VVVGLLDGVDELDLDELAANSDFGFHVAEVEGSADHVPLLAGVHGCEAHGSLSSGVDVVDLVVAGGAVVVRVEEFEPPELALDGVECVLVLLAVRVHDLAGRVVEVFAHFLVSEEDLLEVLLAHVRVAGLVHDAFEGSLHGGGHECGLDHQLVGCEGQHAELHEHGLHEAQLGLDVVGAVHALLNAVALGLADAFELEPALRDEVPGAERTQRAHVLLGGLRGRVRVGQTAQLKLAVAVFFLSFKQM